MVPDFNRVIYFLRVCEHGGVSKAAEQLYITPQALNRHIRLLEEELNEKLFDRTTKTLQLTEFGAFFRNQMQPIYQLYQAAQEQLSRYRGASKQALRVGFFQGIPKRRVIQPVVAELLVGMPDVQIELCSAEMDDIYADLRNGKTDIAITNVNPADLLSDLVQIPLLSLPCMIGVSYHHPWMEKETITVDDMSSNPVLILSRAGGPDKGGFYSRLKASAYHFAPTYNTMMAQLGLGQHYAVFPTLFENLSEIGIKTFPLPEEYRFNFSLALVYRPDSRFAEFFSTLSLLSEKLKNAAD